MINTAIIIPWRDRGDFHRSANLRVVVDVLRAYGLGEVIVSSDALDPEQPFNRSRAYNRGWAEAPDSTEVFIWHEADMVIPRNQLVAAIAEAIEEPGLVIPFDTYHYLGASVVDSARLDPRPEHLATLKADFMLPDGRSIGPVGVSSRASVEAIGQWDEQFHGWGYDDSAMALAFSVANGRKPLRYVEGPGWHLFHGPGWTTGDNPKPAVEMAATAANAERLNLYRDALDRREIRILTKGARRG